MRYLGVDHGLAHIGLAFGDDETYLATPFDTIHESNLEQQLKQIEQIVLDEDVESIVIGLPVNLAGENTGQTDAVLSFISDLEARVSIPVHREDERLTSSFAQKQRSEGGGDEHAVAAMAILQTYLDRLRNDI